MTRGGWLAGAAVAAAILALGFSRISDADLGFHLATGRAILATGHIPATNILTFTEPNHPWLLHEWLPALLFTLAFRAGGPAGVLALKIAVLVPTWLCVFGAALRLGATPVPSALATVLGAAAAASRFSERPQIFSALGLAAVVCLCAAAQRAPAQRARRLLLAAGVVTAVSWQLHAGAATLTFFLLAAALGVALDSRATWLRGPSPRGSNAAPSWRGALPAAWLAAIAAGSLAVAALALALYHPHGARVLTVPFRLGGDSSLRAHVGEYHSPLSLPLGPLHLYWLFFALVALALAVRARQTPLAWLVPVLCFAALSLRFARTVDAFAIAAAPVLAASMVDVGWLLGRAGAGALGLCCLVLPIDQARFRPFGVGYDPRVWPEGLLARIAKEHLRGPAFISDGWAGPYLASFYPPERVYFDPRFEAYSRERVERYRRIRYGEDGWGPALDSAGVQLVLLKYTSSQEAKNERGRPNLRQLLAADPSWSLVAFDDFGELFVRRAGVNADPALRLAIPFVDPDRGVFLGPPRAAALSLFHALESGLSATRAIALCAIAAAQSGDRATAEKLLSAAELQSPGDPQIAEARVLVGVP